MADKNKIKNYTETEKVCAKDKLSEQSKIDIQDEPEMAKEDQTQQDNNSETTLKKAQEEAAQSYDRFLRVSAEFENYKKRSAREMSDFRKFSNESLIKELLGIVDNLERAMISSADDKCVDNHLTEGVKLTLREFLKIFGNFGVKTIESLGEPFDPNFHQAVMREETDKQPENTIINELQKGYTMHGRLLRAAMVTVAVSKTNTKEKNKKTEN